LPLAFPSTSHGSIAFGFFNIESDMLLLEQLFFFADHFCRAVVELVQDMDAGQCSAVLEGWRIRDRAQVGDLHGAIAGDSHEGFIGATYRAHPFPSRPEGFKQNPDGWQTQAQFQELMEPFGETEEICLAFDGRRVQAGEYAFDLQGFEMLVAYVDRGGYPRWKDEVRPQYVTEMTDLLSQAGSPFSRKE